MSKEHPIVAITGSSGSGSSSVLKAFEHIFWRERVRGVYIQGSAFHRYHRKQMLEELARARAEGRVLSHFGPEGNHLDKLETLFFQYGATGTGEYRYYLHSGEHAETFDQEPGTFTPWRLMKKKSDLLLSRVLSARQAGREVSLRGAISDPGMPGVTIPFVTLFSYQGVEQVTENTRCPSTETVPIPASIPLISLPRSPGSRVSPALTVRPVAIFPPPLASAA